MKRGLKDILNIGTLIGLAMFVNASLTHVFTNKNPLTNGNFTGQLILVLGMYIGAKHLKKNNVHLFETYKNSLFTLTKLSLVFSSLYGALLFLLEKILDTGLVEKTKTELEASYILMIENLNVTQQAIFEQGYKNMTLGTLCLSEVMSKFFLGIIISLLLAFSLKNQTDKYKSTP